MHAELLTNNLMALAVDVDTVEIEKQRQSKLMMSKQSISTVGLDESQRLTPLFRGKHRRDESQASMGTYQRYGTIVSDPGFANEIASVGSPEDGQVDAMSTDKYGILVSLEDT